MGCAFCSCFSLFLCRCLLVPLPFPLYPSASLHLCISVTSPLSPCDHVLLCPCPLVLMCPDVSCPPMLLCIVSSIPLCLNASTPPRLHDLGFYSGSWFLFFVLSSCLDTCFFSWFFVFCLFVLCSWLFARYPLLLALRSYFLFLICWLLFLSSYFLVLFGVSLFVFLCYVYRYVNI